MSLFKKEEIIRAERERIIRIINRIKIKCGETEYMVNAKELKEEIEKWNQ